MAMINADVTSMQRFARKLRTARPEMSKNLRKSLREAGNLIRDDARARTDSVKAQKSLRTSVAGSMVLIRTGGPSSPLPALLEGDGTGGTWRHPVMGDREVWVTQQRHPYLHPAFDAKQDDAKKLMARALDDTVNTVMNTDE